MVNGASLCLPPPLKALSRKAGPANTLSAHNAYFSKASGLVPFEEAAESTERIVGVRLLLRRGARSCEGAELCFEHFRGEAADLRDEFGIRTGALNQEGNALAVTCHRAATAAWYSSQQTAQCARGSPRRTRRSTRKKRCQERVKKCVLRSGEWR